MPVDELYVLYIIFIQVTVCLLRPPSPWEFEGEFCPIKVYLFFNKVMFDLYWEEFSRGPWHVQNFHSFIFQGHVFEYKNNAKHNKRKWNINLALLVYIHVYTFCEPQTFISNLLYCSYSVYCSIGLSNSIFPQPNLWTPQM